MVDPALLNRCMQCQNVCPIANIITQILAVNAATNLPEPARSRMRVILASELTNLRLKDPELSVRR